MLKIVLATSAEKFLSDLPEGATGIMIGDEYIPFSRIAKVTGKTIWLKPVHAKDCAVNVGMLGECDCGAED